MGKDKGSEPEADVDVYALLGCREDDARVTRFLQASTAGDDTSMEPTSKDSFGALGKRPSCVYHNFKQLGVSLCFEGSVLQGIHVYNAGHGYQAFHGPLPHGLRMQMRGAEIVNILGEPGSKMGGGRAGPISIAYKDKGLQINFVGSDWDDRENIIDSITIHEPQ